MSEVRNHAISAAAAVLELPEAGDETEAWQSVTALSWLSPQLRDAYGQAQAAPPADDPLTWLAPMASLAEALDEVVAWWNSWAALPSSMWQDSAAKELGLRITAAKDVAAQVLTVAEFCARAEAHPGASAEAETVAADFPDEHFTCACEPPQRRAAGWLVPSISLATAAVVGVVAVIGVSAVLASTKHGRHHVGAGIAAVPFAMPDYIAATTPVPVASPTRATPPASSAQTAASPVPASTLPPPAQAPVDAWARDLQAQIEQQADQEVAQILAQEDMNAPTQPQYSSRWH